MSHEGSEAIALRPDFGPGCGQQLLKEGGQQTHLGQRSGGLWCRGGRDVATRTFLMLDRQAEGRGQSCGGAWELTPASLLLASELSSLLFIDGPGLQEHKNRRWLREEF